MCSPSIVSESERNRIAALNARFREVSKSPFGEDDEIGMLNLMTSESMARVNERDRRAQGLRPLGRLLQRNAELDRGWRPTCQISVIRTPNGNIVDDYAGAGRVQNELVASCGETISMYTHCGTHIDTLCHFGYHGTMWNGFTAVEHLGSRGLERPWRRKSSRRSSRGAPARRRRRRRAGGAPERLRHRQGRRPRVSRAASGSEVRVGDVVADSHRPASGLAGTRRVSRHAPGLNREGAEFLACAGAMVIGADTIGLRAGQLRRIPRTPHRFTRTCSPRQGADHGGARPRGARRRWSA